MRRVFEVMAPGGLAVIESQATEFAGLYDTPLCEFYPREARERPDELVGPQRQGARGACCAAGFRDVEILTSQHVPPPRRPGPGRR